MSDDRHRKFNRMPFCTFPPVKTLRITLLEELQVTSTMGKLYPEGKGEREQVDKGGLNIR